MHNQESRCRLTALPLQGEITLVLLHSRLQHFVGQVQILLVEVAHDYVRVLDEIHYLIQRIR